MLFSRSRNRTLNHLYLYLYYFYLQKMHSLQINLTFEGLRRKQFWNTYLLIQVFLASLLPHFHGESQNKCKTSQYPSQTWTYWPHWLVRTCLLLKPQDIVERWVCSRSCGSTHKWDPLGRSLERGSRRWIDFQSCTEPTGKGLVLQVKLRSREVTQRDRSRVKRNMSDNRAFTSLFINVHVKSKINTLWLSSLKGCTSKFSRMISWTDSFKLMYYHALSKV